MTPHGGQTDGESSCIRTGFIVIESFMQISRSVLLACVAAISLSPLLLQGQETEAQAKARKALENALNQMPSQALPAATPAPAKPAAAAPEEKPQFKSPPPGSVPPERHGLFHWFKRSSPPAPAIEAPAPSSPESMNRAKEALHQKMSEGQTQQKAESAPPSQPSSLPAAPAAPVVTRTPPPAAAPMAAPDAAAEKAAKNEAARQEKERVAAEKAAAKAAREKAAEDAKAQAAAEKAAKKAANEANSSAPTFLELTPSFYPAAPSATAPSVAATPSVTATPSVATAPSATMSPTPALSGSKEERLKQLLTAYKADKISPEEYHQQRAKILAEP